MFKTENELAKSHWWWRRTRFLHPSSFLEPNRYEWREWRDGLEQTAFEYELVKRICKTRELAPFVELDGWMQHQLYHRLCPPRKKDAQIMTSEISVWQHSPSKPPVRIDKGGIIPHGLSKADSDGWRLNLKATDNQLMQYLRAKKSKKTSTLSKSEFLANVNRQRAAQGITPPRGLEGQRNRAVSWRWIELLDITAFKVKRLYKDTDPERQSKRRARVMAQRLLPKYIEAIEEFEASPCRPTEKVRPKPLLAREG